jgi:serine acetyltransferase
MLEHGTCMTGALIQDARAVCQRDPATNTLLEVVLFNKGYVALVCHRVAYRLWHSTPSRKKFTALFL